MTVENPKPELLDYLDLGVSPHQLLGWLYQVIQDGHVVDAGEWNTACSKLRPANRQDQSATTAVT